MKRFFPLLAVAMSFSFVACGEVCTTCTFTYEVAGQSIEATQPEVCGSRGEISDYKDGLQAAADAAATAAGGINATTACVDN